MMRECSSGSFPFVKVQLRLTFFYLSNTHLYWEPWL